MLSFDFIDLHPRSLNNVKRSFSYKIYYGNSHEWDMFVRNYVNSNLVSYQEKMKPIGYLWLAFTISGNEASWCLVGSWFGNVWLIRAGDSSIWTRLCCVTVFCNDLHFSVKRCICFHRRGGRGRASVISTTRPRHTNTTSQWCVLGVTLVRF